MSRRLRVAWVIPTMKAGGTERQLLRLIRGMADDAELTLICTRSEGALIGDVRRIGTYVRVLHYESAWDFRVERRLRRIFEAHTPHVMHTFLSGFDLFANRAARQADVPVIVSSRRELATWQKARHRWLQRRANRYVDAVIANSHAVADYAIEHECIDPNLVHVIPNGIDPARYTPPLDQISLRRRFKLPTTGYAIGMLANFSPVKDHRLFIDMAEALTRKRKDVFFILVGAGPLVDWACERVERRGLGDYFYRFTTISEIPELLGALDISVLTSKAEGFPNALIESMAAGLPVIAANVGGIRELIQDGVTGRLVDSRVPADFANAIAKLLDNPNETAALAKRGNDWVSENLTIERLVDSHRKLYLDLLKRYAEKRA